MGGAWFILTCDDDLALFVRQIFFNHIPTSKIVLPPALEDIILLADVGM